MRYKFEKVVRWIARIISSLSIAYFLFMLIGELIIDFGPISLEGVMIVGFCFSLLLNIIYAWLKEGIGGIILIFISVLFAIFIYITAGSHRILAATLISSPFLLSGILFMVASTIAKAKKNK